MTSDGYLRSPSDRTLGHPSGGFCIRVTLHIIGIPSAGKTTLAKNVARFLGVSHHDLDPLMFVDERWTLRAVPERNAMRDRILEEESFVTEGGFLDWTEPLFAAADHIIWLDPPLRILVWRHVRRHWSNPRLLPSLLRFQVLMYLSRPGRAHARFDSNQTRGGIGTALRPWAHKVLRVRRPVTVQQIVDALGLAQSPT